MKVSFLGAAGTVTGSKYLVESSEFTGPVLVDCGLFQGVKYLRQKNREAPGFDPSELSAVILTHAHMDHSGYIPALVKNGFKGPIFCSGATYDLCKIMLPDSGHLQEEEAKYANKRKFSKHSPALPLYTVEDAKHSLSYFKPVERHKPIPLSSTASFELFSAGHILGASMVRLVANTRSVLFSGDLGRQNDLVMKAPEPLPNCDYLVLESTYGDRKHETFDPIGRIQEIVSDAWKNNSVVIIPALAVGRAQTLLHIFAELKRQGSLPDIPVYLNSPMATKVTGVFCEHTDEHKLEEEKCSEACDVASYVRSPEESKELNERSGPMVIISASGMATGGRVIHHLKSFVSDPKNTVIFAGFQAAGTRGAALVRGTDEIKIHGQYFPVRARIVSLDMLSAHADYVEILDWLETSKARPQKVFITHGEASASDHLRLKISEKFGWDVDVPQLGDERELK